MSELDANLIHHLYTTSGITPISIELVWEDSAWSKTRKVTSVENKIYFLKGIPRTSKEAAVTKILYEYNQAIIPEIIVFDLLPEHDWQWFLMADAGSTNYDSLSLDIAQKTAYQLGQLQRQVAQDKRLEQVLPHCLPNHYLDIIDRVSHWMETRISPTLQRNLEITRTILPTRKKFFNDVADILSSLPMTCVHSDLWSGNIATIDGQIRLLDWDEAIWGVGTTSITQLLSTAEEISNPDVIWDMYGKGFQFQITDTLKRASQVAYAMASLITEGRPTKTQPPQRKLPVGIPPILEELVILSDAGCC